MTSNSEPAEALTLQAVADELGVHYMTAYRYVRLGMLPASKRGRSWVVLREDLDEFTSAPPTSSARGEAPWQERFLNRVLAADDSGAWGVVEAAQASGMSAAEVHTSILIPSLEEVGRLWESGAITVADEHAAAQIANRTVARLGPQMMSRGVRRGTVVLGSTATELHSLPLSIAADLLRSARFEVIDLGANLPPESFAAAVERADDIVAVAIGVTTRGQDDEIRRTVRAIRDARPVPVIVGGAGIDTMDPAIYGADAVAVTAADAIAEIEELVR